MTLIALDSLAADRRALIDLADLALRMLNKQQEYFRSGTGAGRSRTALAESKALEKELREKAREIVAPYIAGVTGALDL